MTDKLVTAIIVVIAVPAVLVGYIWGTEQVLRLVPERMKPPRPALALAAAGTRLPGLLPDLPDDRDGHPQPPGQVRGKKFVGLDQLRMVLRLPTTR